MSSIVPLPLPLFETHLLRLTGRIVPIAERAEWSRSWQAELWHLHHRSRSRSHLRSLALLTDLSIGVLRDALWLRTESWRRAFSGTALLCLAWLLSLGVLSLLIALSLAGSRVALDAYLAEHFVRALYASPLVLFVAFATASRRHLERRSTRHKFYWLRRQLFFAIKSAQVLLLAFLLSADLALPSHASAPNTSDFLQILSFVVCSLIGLRWSLADQEKRCKHCLQALAIPARVGRPSRNLLEWNGTELTCKHGHGLLSIPEMETSWCRSSQWIILDGVRKPFAEA